MWRKRVEGMGPGKNVEYHDDSVIEIRALRKQWKEKDQMDEENRKKTQQRFVGGFRIRMPRITYTYRWIVSSRKDKRHGVVEESKVGMSDYAKSLLESALKGW